MRDVTEIMTIGYDCMMTVPDRNMGLWQEVWLEWTGPVDIRDPFVVTDLPLAGDQPRHADRLGRTGERHGARR